MLSLDPWFLFGDAKRIDCYLEAVKMSIELKLDNVDLNQPEKNPIKLHYIPASIEEATTANVDQYFDNYTTEVDGC